MTLEILSTKLHIPSITSSHVHRPLLAKTLDHATQGKLVLLSAPAGFGKTTLLADWAACCADGRWIAWLHLEQADNELTRFLTYLIASIRTVDKTIGEPALTALESLPPPPIEAVLTSLINEIAVLKRSLVLVLDDYHLIETKEIHTAVKFLLDHLPEHTCIVIATRSDPPLPLFELRSHGQMSEIRADLLRFNTDEMLEFFSNQMEYVLTAEDVAVLNDRVEGWIAGLQMLALSLQGKQDAHDFIERFSGSHRFIMDYLTEEIFNQQTEQVQTFLLLTSVLNRLSGPLCDQVLNPGEPTGAGGEMSSSQEILEFLERENLFLLPLDDDRRWYRYHHLFAELLRQRLRRSSPNASRKLLRRASDWCVQNGFIEEAFEYALSADDPLAAAEIIENTGYGLLQRGALSILLSWFKQLPKAVVKSRSRLCMVYAWLLLLSGQVADIETYLISVESGSGQVSPGQFDGEIAAIRAYAAARGEAFETALGHAHTALKLLPKEEHSIRSVVEFVMGGIYAQRGQIQNAIDALHLATQDGEQSGNLNSTVSAFNFLASLLMQQNRPIDAEKMYLRALSLGSDDTGRPLPITAGIHANLARLYLERDEINRAREYARKSIDLTDEWVHPESHINALLAIAQIAHHEGAHIEVEHALEEVRRLSAVHMLTPGTQELIDHVQTSIKRADDIPAEQGLIEPLSERELEVLRLLAEGFSNPEIAETLIIAVGTVKAHTATIYRKLEVNNRTQAVVRGRELALI